MAVGAGFAPATLASLWGAWPAMPATPKDRFFHQIKPAGLGLLHTFLSLRKAGDQADVRQRMLSAAIACYRLLSPFKARYRATSNVIAC
jgi:hypothetical protein